MLACVFWNHVNNFYTNILYTVYIYNHTSRVGRWRKIFFLRCLYSKLLFLHRAQWPGLQCPLLYLSEFGVWFADKHTAIPDTQRLQPCTCSSVCLHMWHTDNLLPAFCFSFFPSLYSLSERFPPELPVSHNAPWILSGCTRGKKVLGRKASLVQFTPFPLFSSPLSASLTLLYQQQYVEVSHCFALFTCKCSLMVQIHPLLCKINIGIQTLQVFTKV